MLKELQGFIKRLDGMPIRTPLRGEAADAAIEKGMEYFRKHGKNFAPDSKAVHDALRGLSRIRALKEFGAPVANAAHTHAMISLWGESYILAGDSSTHAFLFKQGQTNPSWSSAARTIAKEACEFFRI